MRKHPEVPPLSQRIVLFTIYSFPALFVGGAVWVGFHSFWGLAAYIYILPPITCRLLVAVLGKPQGRFPLKSKGFFCWFMTYQLQAVFLRFPFLEEIIRLVPRLYSVWLRLWGAKVGGSVTWSPEVLVCDRPFVEVGDFATFGLGVQLTSHLLTVNKDGEFELILASPKIGAKSLLGARSGLGPGAVVGENEMLPATILVGPFYRWENNRRVPPQSEGGL